MAASCEPDFSSWDPHNKRLVYCDMGTFSTASKFRTVAMFLNPTDLSKLATENITKQRFWSLDHPVDTKCSLRLRTKSCCVSIFLGGRGHSDFSHHLNQFSTWLSRKGPSRRSSCTCQIPPFFCVSVTTITQHRYYCS